jgi:hypothetical protein
MVRSLESELLTCSGGTLWVKKLNSEADRLSELEVPVTSILHDAYVNVMGNFMKGFCQIN